MDTREVAKIRINAHYDGMKQGIWEYAWWSQGVQYVGTTGRTFKEVVKEIESRREEALKALEEKG